MSSPSDVSHGVLLVGGGNPKHSGVMWLVQAWNPTGIPLGEL